MRSPFTMAAALAVAGCATTYQPQNGPRVHEVLDQGRVVLERDGTRYPSTPDGLWRAVRGNHKAEVHAAEFGMWKSFGMASLLLGSGFVAGASYAESQGSIPVRNGLVAAGISAAVAGVAMFVVAQPHYYDAINVYNDGVEARR